VYHSIGTNENMYYRVSTNRINIDDYIEMSAILELEVYGGDQTRGDNMSSSKPLFGMLCISSDHKHGIMTKLYCAFMYM